MSSRLLSRALFQARPFLAPVALHPRCLFTATANIVMDQPKRSRRGRGGGRGGRGGFGRRRFHNQANAASGEEAQHASAGQEAEGGEAASPTKRRRTTDGDDSNPPLTIAVPTDTPSFADLGKDNLIHPVIVKTLTDDLKFDHMTPVQAATIYELLGPRPDVLAQAKTGTGKTIAFLLPAIQALLNRDTKPGEFISLLVLSPTRELAMQIAKEAEALLKRMPEYKVRVAIGGTNKSTEESRIQKGCDILIATPGRLDDYLKEESSIVREKIKQLDTLVLDEADRLLDMGFLPQIKKICEYLPDRKVVPRQGMLFSATIAPRIESVAHLVLNPGYKFISTIQEGEVNTHERVQQNLITVPTFSDVTPALVGAVRQEIAVHEGGAKSFKAIIFAPTGGLADFYSYVLRRITDLKIPVHTLHSRLSQSRRTKITAEYRAQSSGILVATDVIARGMDFPSVSHVLQVGVPSDRESYIHRLGRTARAGAEGRGVFIIAKPEEFFPHKTLKDIKFIREEPDLSSREDVQTIVTQMETDVRAKVYQGWMGFYKNSIKQLKWSVADLVSEGNKLVLQGMGASEVPALKRLTIGKMGLKGVPGLKVAPPSPVDTGGSFRKRAVD